jgi:hypothetical protein
LVALYIEDRVANSRGERIDGRELILLPVPTARDFTVGESESKYHSLLSLGSGLGGAARFANSKLAKALDINVDFTDSKSPKSLTRLNSTPAVA